MKKEELEKRTKKYLSSYIKKSDAPPARHGKSLYISKEHHERISQIIAIIALNEVGLYDYVNNVLTEHFDKYQDEIVNSFAHHKLY